VDVFAFGTLMWEAMANDIPFVAWRITGKIGVMGVPHWMVYKIFK
jgi:hypothetical protein